MTHSPTGYAGIS